MPSNPGDFTQQPDQSGRVDALRLTRWQEAAAPVVVPPGPAQSLDALVPPVPGRAVQKIQNLTGGTIQYGYSTAATFELADREVVEELVADGASIFVAGGSTVAYAQGVR